MQLLEPDDYHIILSYYMLASQAQEEVRRYEKLLKSKLEDKTVLEKLSDTIYDPANRGTKKEFDDLIFTNGISIKWKETQTKFAKEPKENDVSG